MGLRSQGCGWGRCCLETPLGKMLPSSLRLSDCFLASEELRPRAQGVGGRPGSSHLTTALENPGRWRGPYRMGDGKGQGAWPDEGGWEPGGQPLWGPRDHPGTAWCQGPSSVPWALDKSSRRARAPSLSAARQGLPGPSRHPAAQPHGSHKARPQESSLGTEDPALQAGLRGATQAQAQPG